MSETTTEQATPSRAEQIDAAWENAQVPVEGAETPANETPAAEDFNEKPEPPVSAAPSIREFIRAQKTPADPTGPAAELAKEVSELRAALAELRTAGSQEAAPSREELVLEKLEALEAKEREQSEADATAKAQEVVQQKHAALRAGALATIEANKEKYPGLIALEQQETVVNALFAALDEDEDADVSEDSLSSEVETGLQEVYQKLHAVYGNLSQEATPASDRPVTLNPGLVGNDEGEVDLSKMSRQEKVDYLWAKNQKQL